MRSTIDDNEVSKFSEIANQWWDEDGKFKPLHKFNPARISYIKERLIEYFALDSNSKTPLAGLRVLDIGCGGGLICEPLARLGAEVTGLDPSEKNIAVAKFHAEENGLSINYLNLDIEEFSLSLAQGQNKKYDVVLALEVVEHVANLENFIAAASKCLIEKKSQSLMFIATINRTAQSYLKAIIGAEYVLRWLKIGTHQWKKFLKPSELNSIAKINHLELLHLDGFSYNLIGDNWKISSDLSVNYIMVFKGL